MTGPTGEESETITGHPFEQTPSVPLEAIQLLSTAFTVKPEDTAKFKVIMLLALKLVPEDISIKKLAISPQAKLCPFAVVESLGSLKIPPPTE
jgi:hypothetical protein